MAHLSISKRRLTESQASSLLRCILFLSIASWSASIVLAQSQVQLNAPGEAALLSKNSKDSPKQQDDNGLAPNVKSTLQSEPAETDDLSSVTLAPGPSELSKSDLETQLKAVESSVDLSEAEKAQILDLIKKTIARIDQATSADQRAVQLTRQLAAAPKEIESEQKELERLSSLSSPSISDFKDLNLEELRNQHRVALAQLSQADQAVSTLLDQAESWTSRINRLPTISSESRTALNETEKQLGEIQDIDTTDSIIAARRQLLLARVNQLREELQLLEVESRAAEDVQQLLSLQRDSAARKQLLAQKEVETLQAALANAEKQQAKKEVQQAKWAEKFTDPAIRAEAAFNSELAKAKEGMLNKLESDRKAIVEAREQYLTMKDHFTDTQQQAEAAGFSKEIGLLLRNEKNELPDTNVYRERSKKRRQAINGLTVEILKRENEHQRLLDLDAAIAAKLGAPDLKIAKDDRQRVEQQLREILNDRLTLYRDLTEVAGKRMSRLANLEADEMKLVDLIDDHIEFVSEHVLWVPSTTPFSLSLFQPAVQSLVEFAEPSKWRIAAHSLWEDIKRKPFASIPVWALLGWLLFSRGTIKKQIERLGEQAANPRETSFAPTASTMMMTVFIAAPAALLMIWLGWRLAEATSIGSDQHLFGRALFSGGALLYAIDFVRHVFRPDGLADAHFDWELTSNHLIRRGLVWSARIIMPCAIIVLYSELLNDDVMVASLGRFAFAIAMVTCATILWKWLEPNGVMMSRLHATKPSWVAGVGYALLPALAAVPIILLIASFAGYHYAAVQMSWRFAVSIGILAFLVVSRALLLRWLLVLYRRVAIARARERREALQHAKESTVEMPIDAADLIETAGHVQLSDLNRQAQSFVRLLPIMLGSIGLYWTWSEFIPAFSVVHRYPLWLNVLQATEADATPIYVTLGDLFLAFVAVGITTIACQNVPGLLDITILQRLPLDAGARYAASALTRYALIVIGSLATFHFLGVSWSSVQWLVAAITVGLGFGLQEIFANFVSGIILLFERPARVGDTVTIGDITGTVTRIRIRATTILDWDNKELIVPNKEFVTGNLINWTLSSASLRLVTTVGVAYGSDTRLVTDLLYKITSENPTILDDPEPSVIFNEFGDSTLNFQVRVFTNGLVNFRRLKHDLHMAIDDAFREHDIEIAFPQRDLHLRSVDDVDLKMLARQ